eukprot:151529-Rhodomonas_salina.1
MTCPVLTCRIVLLGPRFLLDCGCVRHQCRARFSHRTGMLSLFPRAPSAHAWYNRGACRALFASHA